MPAMKSVAVKKVDDDKEEMRTRAIKDGLERVGWNRKPRVMRESNPEDIPGSADKVKRAAPEIEVRDKVKGVDKKATEEKVIDQNEPDEKMTGIEKPKGKFTPTASEKKAQMKGSPTKSPVIPLRKRRGELY